MTVRGLAYVVVRVERLSQEGQPPGEGVEEISDIARSDDEGEAHNSTTFDDTGIRVAFSGVPSGVGGTPLNDI